MSEILVLSKVERFENGMDHETFRIIRYGDIKKSRIIPYHNSNRVKTMKCSRYILLFVYANLFFNHQIIAQVKHKFPRIANYFSGTNFITDQESKDLAKWDLVIIDYENQYYTPQNIERIKSINNNIILLPYIDAGAILDVDVPPASFRGQLRAGIDSTWFVRDTTGNIIDDGDDPRWPSTKMLNCSDWCPTVNGETWNSYLSKFVVNKFMFWDDWCSRNCIKDFGIWSIQISNRRKWFTL